MSNTELDISLPFLEVSSSENQPTLRVFIITQDEPFYLAGAIEYLFSILPEKVSVSGAYVLNGSPFGVKKSFLQKAMETARIFGLRFFLFFSWQFIKSKLFKKSVEDVLKGKIPFVRVGEISLNSEDSLKEIRSHSPDIIVSLASNQIFRKPLLELPEQACLNLHTAKLPKYRGLMPLFWAMACGDTEIGLTVFKMDEGLDSGPIVRQAEVPVADYSMHDLIKQTKFAGMLLMAQALRDFQRGDVVYTTNDDSRATRVKFPTREDVRRFKATGRRLF